MPQNFINANADNTVKKLKNTASEPVTVAEAVGYLLSHKFLFIISITVCLFIAVIHIWRTPKQYSRTATIMVKDEKKGINMEESQNFKDVITLNNNTVENQLGLLKSKRLMQKVVEQLNLNVSYQSDNMKKTQLYTQSPLVVEYKANPDSVNFSFRAEVTGLYTVELTQEEPRQRIACVLGTYQDTPWGKLKISFSPKADLLHVIGEVVHISAVPLSSVAKAYNSQLSVAMVNKESSLVNLSLVDENKHRAEDVLNTLIEVYSQESIDDKLQIVKNSANIIKERLATLERELATIDTQVELYKKDNQLTTLEAESSIYLSHSNTMDLQELELENQLNMVEYMKDYLRRNSSKTEMIPASINITDGGIQQQINAYNNLMAQKIKILSSSSDRNPLVLDLNKTLASQRSALNKALDNLTASLNIQIMNIRDKEDVYVEKIMDLPTQQKELLALQRQQKTKEDLYLYLLNKKEENELQRVVLESACKVIDYANGSDSPVAPNKIQILAMALIAGCMLPGIWLYLLMLFDTKVHTKNDLRGKLSVPILGEIPLDKERTAINVLDIDNRERTSFNESIRTIRENLRFLFSKRDANGKVIQIISMNPTAGKTFVAINLAASCAFANKRVIILDLDLRKMSLSRQFNLNKKSAGLSDYLAGEPVTPEDIVYNIITLSGSFDIIPSGEIPPNPVELLKDSKLDELVAYLKERYDYVICDNPPYNMVVDAAVCSRFSDATVYIIRSGLFEKRAIGELQELYESQKLSKMGIVLNGVDFERNRYFSYRYSDYRYSYYDDDYKKKESPIKKLLKRLKIKSI